MNVKHILQQLGWTYAEAAHQTGYSLDMIQSVALGRRDLPKPLAKLLSAAVEQQRTQVARIFVHTDGYHVCSNARTTLDTRNPAYRTKAAALRAAAEMGYTKATGSGTYWTGIRLIPAKYRDTEGDAQ